MEAEIYPKEILNQTTHNLSFRHTVRSQILYSSTLIFLIGVFAALPFIEIDVGVKSDGIIKAVSGRHVVDASLSGRVAEVSISENMAVKKGQLLVAIQTDNIDERIHYNKKRQTLLRNYIEDLKSLKSGSINSSGKALGTTLYQSEWAAFRQEINELLLSIKKLELTHNRNKKLFEKSVISQSEYEEASFRLETEKQRLKLLNDSKESKWERDLAVYQKELDDLKSKAIQLQQERKNHFIHAPIDGVAQNVAGIYENSMINVNDQIAVITPDNKLIAEFYVSTKDIGLIKEGMNVHIQVDAFNYNQWGFLQAVVTNVSNDVSLIQEQAVFLVRCTLEKDYLTLQNGYKGNLKKGMTINGRFIVARRSLFQLLYDNIDDWLNPV